MPDDVPFYLTRQGRELLESTIPRIARELETLNRALAKLIESLDSTREKPP